jgi:hypothetical protein
VRVPISVSLCLALAAALTACASVAAPPASRTTPHPDAATRALTVPPAGSTVPPAGSKPQAAALARTMLSRLRLPPGARRLPSVPLPSSLKEPAVGYAGGSASLDQYRLFAAPQPMGSVAAFLASHVPAGLGKGGTGQGSGSASGPFMEVSYVDRPAPAGVAAAGLVVTVVPAASGGSLLRADAQVTWYPPRTAAEYIDPARYHALTITATLYGQRIRKVRKVVTSQAVITRFARALDRSPAAPPGAMSCPAEFADYQLGFSVSGSSRPVIVVWTQGICGGSAITVGGHPQPALQDDGAVAALADQVLHVTPGP